MSSQLLKKLERPIRTPDADGDLDRPAPADRSAMRMLVQRIAQSPAPDIRQSRRCPRAQMASSTDPLSRTTRRLEEFRGLRRDFSFGLTSAQSGSDGEQTPVGDQAEVSGRRRESRPSASCLLRQSLSGCMPAVRAICTRRRGFHRRRLSAAANYRWTGGPSRT
jgi:hypothetical protein